MFSLSFFLRSINHIQRHIGLDPIQSTSALVLQTACLYELLLVSLTWDAASQSRAKVHVQQAGQQGSPLTKSE
jgi:hypothetical protein